MITARRNARAPRQSRDIMLLANGRYGSPQFGTVLGPLLRDAGVYPEPRHRRRRRSRS